MNRHLNDDELLDLRYGLRAEDGHLENCLECRRRWNEFEKRRAALRTAEEVPGEFLAAQRRRIYARLGERPPSGMRWAPALGAAGLLAIGIFMYRPVAPPHPEATDELFADVYSMEQSTEPRAAAPIHALFEDNQ